MARFAYSGCVRKGDGHSPADDLQWPRVHVRDPKMEGGLVIRSVLIADSNTRLSELVGQLLADEPHFDVVGVHHSAAAVLKAARARRPDVVLLSQRLDGVPVDALLGKLRGLVPRAALVLWTHDAGAGQRYTSQVDAVLERGITFRQLVSELRPTRRGESAPALPVPSMPSVAEPAAVDLAHPAAPDVPVEPAAGLLLHCQTCQITVGLDTDHVAPAVDQARAFFDGHVECSTRIDLLDRVGADA